MGGVKITYILHRLLLANLIALCGIAHSWSADGADQDANSPPWLPNYLRRFTNSNGERSKLERAGVRSIFTYYGDAFANPVGGVTPGIGYFGRFGTIIDDLQKLVGWSGATFHASIHQIHETDFDVRNLDNLMTVSGIGIGYPVSTRLLNRGGYGWPCICVPRLPWWCAQNAMTRMCGSDPCPPSPSAISTDDHQRELTIMP